MTDPTPCAGKWDLFDSTELDDHFEARNLCDRCPIRDDCYVGAENAVTLNQQQYGRAHVSGTWGGRLFGRTGYHHSQNIQLTPTPLRSVSGCPSSCEGCGEAMVRRGVVDDSAVKYAARGLCETCYSRVRHRARRVEQMAAEAGLETAS